MTARHGRLLGAVPYDFRPPTTRRVRDTWWNPNDDRIIQPQVFGVGWGLNLAALKRRYPAAFWALAVFVGWRVFRKVRRLAR